MSRQNVIQLNPERRVLGRRINLVVFVTLIFMVCEALMFVGLVSAFLLTRASTDAVWPPAGQPWFSTGKTAVNTAALLLGGFLVLRGMRASRAPEARFGPMLLAGITLGVFFLFFQGLLWFTLLRDGLSLATTHHGKFFCIIVGMHAAHTLGALALLSLVWVRLKPLRDDAPVATLSQDLILAACIPWYFAVAIWPVLWLLLYR